MAAFENIEQISAWQKARELTQLIYRISNGTAFSKDFALRDQIRRAGVSIMSNIAEGYERSGTGEFVQFLSIAKGSVGEVISQLYVAHDQRYISDQEFQQLSRLAKETGRIIAG
ncbi:MAG TPA: four helix bundle protein [Candidatus Binatia bacterium]